MAAVMKCNGVARLAANGLLVLCALGCGRRAGNERFVPSERTAKNALSAAFTAWKAGEPIGTIRLIDPPVNLEVADSGRRRGQQLVEYEILGEVAAEGPRSFAVRLSLAQPREDLEVLYYVVGGILIADEVIDLLLPVLFYWVRRWRLTLHHSSHDS